MPIPYQPIPRPQPGLWARHAACAGEPVDLWFADEQTPAGRIQTSQALAVCADCPVRLQCLHHALTAPELWGVWGGMTAEQRRRVRRKRRPKITRTGPFDPAKW